MGNTTRNILSIAAAVATSFCLGAVLIYICAMTISNEDKIGGILFFLSIGIFIPTFSGGFICGYISNQKDNSNILISSFY